MKFDRKRFFDSYRASFGALRQLQVDGLEFLLSAIESDPEWKSIQQIAYFLATIKHETGITRNGVDQAFQPIKELRARPGTKVRKLQDRYWGSEYFGRGYIQLTWEENYKKFGLADVPDDALQPETAYMIASRGMRNGMFTKYKLSDFVNGDVDYVNARKVVNGLDKANHIAVIAEKFERILKASKVQESVVDLVKEETRPETDKATEPLPTRPNATTADVVVQAEQPKETNPKEKAEVSGIKSHVAALVTFLTTGGAGVLSWAQGASVMIVVGFFSAAALVGTIYIIMRYWYRNRENQRLAEVQLKREQMAHELTLLKIKSAMDKDSNTVEIAKP